MTFKKALIVTLSFFGLLCFTNCYNPTINSNPVLPEKKLPSIKIEVTQDEFVNVIPYITTGVATAKIENSSATEVEFSSSSRFISFEKETVEVIDGTASCTFTVSGDCDACTITASIPSEEDDEITASATVKSKIASPADGGVTFNSVTATDHEIPLSWTNDKSYTCFVINYSWTQPGSSIPLTRTIIFDNSITEYELKQLYSNCEYTVEVLGITNSGYTIKSATYTTETDVTPPSGVQNLAAEPGEYFIDLSWNNPAASDVSKIVISVESSISETIPSIVITPETGTFFSPNDKMETRITGLSTNKDEGVEYTVTVKVYDDSDNYSAGSDKTIKASTLPDTTPPANVTNIVFDFAAGKISWTNPEDTDYAKVYITVGAETKEFTKSSEETASVAFAKGDKVTFVTEDALGNKNQEEITVTIPTVYGTLLSVKAGATGQLVGTIKTVENDEYEYSYRLVSGINKGSWKNAEKLCLNGLETGVSAAVRLATKIEMSEAVIIYEDAAEKSAEPVELLVKLVCQHDTADDNPCYVASALAADDEHSGCFFVNKNNSLYKTYASESVFYVRPGLADPDDPDAISYESFRSSGYYLAWDSGKVHTNETSGSPVDGFDSGNNACEVILSSTFETKLQKSNATFEITEAYNKAEGYFSIILYKKEGSYLRKWWNQVSIISSKSQLNDTPSCASMKYEPFTYVAPAAVSGLEAANITGSKVTLNWTDPSNTDISYIVVTADEKYSSGNDIEETVAAGTGTLQLKKLKSNTEYTFTVQAYDIFGKAGASETVSATTLLQYNEPSGLTATATSTGQVVVEWEDSIDENVVSYTVTGIPAAGENVSKEGILADVKKAVFNNLTPGVEYTFTVKAVISEESSYTSTSVAVTPVELLVKLVCQHGTVADNPCYVVSAFAKDNLHAGCFFLNKNDDLYDTYVGESVFYVRPGLADPEDSDAISYESFRSSGYYLAVDKGTVHNATTSGSPVEGFASQSQSTLIVLTSSVSTEEKKANATFNKIAAYNGAEGYFSIVSYNTKEYMRKWWNQCCTVSAAADIANDSVCDSWKYEPYSYVAPAPVTSVTESDVMSSKVTLNWTAPAAGEISYILITADKQNAKSEDILVKLAKDKVSATIENLLPETEYTFTVKAYDIFGNESEEVTKTVTTEALSKKPYDVAATVNYTAQIVVSWEDSIDENVVSYTVTGTSASGENVSKEGISGGVKKAVFNNLKLGEEYTFTVKAIIDAENLYTSDSAKATPEKVIWKKVIGGYDERLLTNNILKFPQNGCKSDFSVIAENPSEAEGTSGNCAVVNKDILRFQSWIVYPSLTKPDDPDYFSLMASTSAGIKTGYYLYADKTRSVSDTANLKCWWTDLGTVNSWQYKLFVAKLSETYLNTTAKQKFASFKKFASPTGEDWFNLQCEGNDWYVQHGNCVYKLVDSINDQICADLKILQSTTSTSEEGIDGAPADVINTSYTSDYTSVTVTWTPAYNGSDFTSKDHDYVILSTTGVDADGNAIEPVKLDAIATGITKVTYTFTNLTPGTAYPITIKAVDYDGNESAGVVIDASTVTPPSDPIATDVAVSAKYTTTAVVTWTDTPLADTYTYKVTATPASGTAIVKSDILAGTQRAYLTGLTVGTEYKVVVTSIDETSTEYNSSEVTHTHNKVVKKITNMHGGLLTNSYGSLTADYYVSYTFDSTDNGAEQKWILWPGLAAPEDETAVSIMSYSHEAEEKYLVLDTEHTFSESNSGNPSGGWDSNNNHNVLILNDKPESSDGNSKATFILGDIISSKGDYSMRSYSDSSLYIRKWWDKIIGHTNSGSGTTDDVCSDWKFEDVE